MEEAETKKRTTRDETENRTMARLGVAIKGGSRSRSNGRKHEPWHCRRCEGPGFLVGGSIGKDAYPGKFSRAAEKSGLGFLSLGGLVTILPAAAS